MPRNRVTREFAVRTAASLVGHVDWSAPQEAREAHKEAFWELAEEILDFLSDGIDADEEMVENLE